MGKKFKALLPSGLLFKSLAHEMPGSPLCSVKGGRRVELAYMKMTILQHAGG